MNKKDRSCGLCCVTGDVVRARRHQAGCTRRRHLLRHLVCDHVVVPALMTSSHRDTSPHLRPVYTATRLDLGRLVAHRLNTAAHAGRNRRAVDQWRL